jgi:hypothetical protein
MAAHALDDLSSYVLFRMHPVIRVFTPEEGLRSRRGTTSQGTLRNWQIGKIGPSPLKDVAAELDAWIEEIS